MLVGFRVLIGREIFLVSFGQNYTTSALACLCLADMSSIGIPLLQITVNSGTALDLVEIERSTRLHAFMPLPWLQIQWTVANHLGFTSTRSAAQILPMFVQRMWVCSRPSAQGPEILETSKFKSPTERI
eukprot:s2252_g2.t1